MSTVPQSDELETQPDEVLVAHTRQGSADALQLLLRRHEPWIYNLVLYMLHHRQDAEDATQEILIKAATGLSSFKQQSSFRTWVRRVAVNHVLDFRRSRPEQTVTGFGCYAEYLDRAGDSDLPERPQASPELDLLIEEARISCTMGMLLCLDREQRLSFLIGEILETDDATGAELLGISRDNFRQRLSRARQQLGSFMQGRCGLVNRNNPCRCARKTAAFIRDGIVDPSRLQFADRHLEQVERVITQRQHELSTWLSRTRAELRELYPLFEPPKLAGALTKLLSSSDLRSALAPVQHAD